MRKILISLLSAILVASLALSCTPQAPEPSPAPTPVPTPTPAPKPPEKPQVQKIIIAALPVGTSVYSTMVGVSQLINQYSGVISVVEPVTSPYAWFELMEKGEIHLQHQQATEAWHVWQGEGGRSWEGIWPVPKPYKEMRLLMQTNNMYYNFITGTFTGITSIPQLKGKKVGRIYPTIPATAYSAAMLRAYGLDPEKDVKSLKYPFTTHALADLVEKKNDAVITTMGGGKIVEVDAKVGAVWLPFDPAKIGVVQELEPMIQSGVGQPYVPGVKQPTPAIAIPNWELCDKSLSDEVAYAIVKALMEHAKELSRATWEFNEWGKETAIVSNTFMPYHPGAVKYFKEIGIWTNEQEALQQKLLAQLPK